MPEDPLLPKILILLLLILINAFFAAAEIALISLSESKLKKQLEEEEKENPRLLAALARKAAVCARIDELTQRQQELEKLKPDPAKCRFEASTVYPPTLLTIGGAIWKFEETKNSCVAILNKDTGEIRIS